MDKCKKANSAVPIYTKLQQDYHQLMEVIKYVISYSSTSKNYTQYYRALLKELVNDDAKYFGYFKMCRVQFKYIESKIRH